MRDGYSAVNLSIDREIAKAVKTFVIQNRRRGRKNVSELTQNLWIAYLRKCGGKLPPLTKKGVSK